MKLLTLAGCTAAACYVAAATLACRPPCPPPPTFGTAIVYHSPTGERATGTLYGVSTFADGTRDFILRLPDGSALPVSSLDCRPAR